MQPIHKSNKLNNVCYDIRGPVLQRAREMEEDGQRIIKLNIGNPAAFGFEVPEEIQQDVIRNMSKAGGYTDSKGLFEPRKAIMHYTQSKHINGVTVDDIIIGNGVSELIVMAMQGLLNNGDEILVPMPDYPLWTAAVNLASGTARHYLCDEATGWMPDLKDIESKINANTRGIVVINPNNPTGTLIAKAELKGFLSKVPKHVLIVLDEAYDEYLSDEHKSEAINWLKAFDNLIISRTFSKAYGLAGLRVGFGLTSPEIADLMNRVRQPFNVNSMAQVAAVASLADEAFVERTRALNQAGMVQITQGLSELGLEYIPSFGNFVSFKVADAAGVNQRLLAQGVIVRPIANYEMPDYLRVSVGLFTENERFLEALKGALRPS